MSNVPESASYDAGIYQLETVDEVLGGVNGKANAQAKGLANRTNWLKSQVDALNTLKGKGVVAFSIAKNYVAGEIVDYQKNIYRANTTITAGAWNATQWDKLLGTAAEKTAQTGVLDQTIGALMMVEAFGIGSSAVESASGANELDSIGVTGFRRVLSASVATVNGPPGAVGGVVLTVCFSASNRFQSYEQIASASRGWRRFLNAGVWSPWVEDMGTSSPVFTGNPTTPTQPQFDNDTSIANTAFVQRALGNRSSAFQVISDMTLTEADYGKCFNSNTGPFTITLPAHNDSRIGCSLLFVNRANSTLNIVCAGTDVIDIGATSVSSVLLGPGDSLELTVSNSSQFWIMSGGTFATKYASVFGASLATNGYVKHPSGIIIQWGVASGVNNSAGVNVTFPIAFPIGAFAVVATHQAPGSGPGSRIVETVIRSGTYFDAYGNTTANSVYWIAIGR